jgi:hypothetical protein
MRLLRTSLPQLPAPPFLSFHFFPLLVLKTKKLLQLTYDHLENSLSLSLSLSHHLLITVENCAGKQTALLQTSLPNKLI